ncbi:nucleoside triphosphate pyrophosphohydrolase [Streptomyces sp. NPDC057623]|uniref:nucleoside triphosphate pyrophosphohydrolase n=1 Tax=Streptomyces sp. NPDC057623 TaxID=3346187 RepID=UPI0036C9C9EA
MNRQGEQGKLVRDRIPQIIREGGAEPVTYVAGPEDYRSRLRDKLREEVAEFLDSSGPATADHGRPDGPSVGTALRLPPAHDTPLARQRPDLRCAKCQPAILVTAG